MVLPHQHWSGGTVLALAVACIILNCFVPSAALLRHCQHGFQASAAADIPSVQSVWAWIQHGFQAPAAVDSPSVHSVWAWMNTSDLDITEQMKACAALQEVSQQGRKAEAMSNSGNHKVATKFLDEGIGAALTQGMAHCLAKAHAEEWQIKECTEKCKTGVDGLAIAYDHDKGVHLLEHAPHFWDGYVEYYRRFRSDKRVMQNMFMFAGLFGSSTPEATPGFAKAGGFDLVFDTLRDNCTDYAICWSALAALSDHVQASRLAAELVANHGGPQKGIEFLVKAMRQVHGTVYKKENDPNGFGWHNQYEVVHDTNGLLWHDDERHTWRDAFYHQGYIDALLPLMAEDPDDQHVQDNCCQAIYWMSHDNSPYQEELATKGAIQLMAKAMKIFAPRMLNDYCTVVHSCSTALLTFAASHPRWLAQIRQLGVGSAMTDKMMRFQVPKDGGTPGKENFPSHNMLKLKSMLQ